MSTGSLAEAFVDILPNMARFGETLKKDLDKSADDAGKSASKRLSSTLVAGVKAAAAGAAVGHFLFSSVEAYTEAQQAEEKLAFAYEKFPALADVTLASLKKLGEEKQKTTRYDHEQTISAESVLAQYKLTGSQIETLIPLVQDYARKTGVDLDQAATIAGKAILGQGRALKDVGINFTNTGSAAGNFAELQAALNDKVGGFAEKEGKTAADQAVILGNEYNDLKESVGAALVPALQDLLSVVTPIVSGFNSLPGPVKTVAVGVGTLAAVSLVLIPRLAETRAALIAMGVGGGQAAVGLEATAAAEVAAGDAAVVAGAKMGVFAGKVGLGLAAVSLLANEKNPTTILSALDERLGKLASDQGLPAAAAEFKKYTDALHLNDDQIKHNLDQMPIYSAALGLVKDGAAAAINPTNVLSDALKAESDALKATRDAAVSFNKPFIDVQEAQIGVRDSTRNMVAALTDSHGVFTTGSAKADVAKASILAFARGVDTQAKAMEDAGAPNKAIVSLYDSQRLSLIKTLEKMGVAKDTAEKYAGQLLTIPKSVKTQLLAEVQAVITRVTFKESTQHSGIGGGKLVTNALGDLSAKQGVPRIVGDGGRSEVFVPNEDGTIYSSVDNAMNAMRGTRPSGERVINFTYNEAPGRTGKLSSQDVAWAMFMLDATSGSSRGG